jgi:peptidyl-prolyl cis-trans isomerase B (cyclophilin B)
MIAAASLALAVFGVGCSRSSDPGPDGEVKVERRSKEKTDSSAKQPVKVEAGLHQPFAAATRQDPPYDYPPPPDVTLTGKSVGKLYTEVVRTWDSVRFASDEGKRIEYTAQLETELGNIRLELRPDWAPNHVRNFVALARVGYYDGLLFERIIHQESDTMPGAQLDLIEAGCPQGAGEICMGSIGYWLKPEFSTQPRHTEEGIIGACRGEEADTAACRFYITLNKAPYLDGNYSAFGKVTQGLDVARKIFQQPVQAEEGDIEGDHRPVKPVVIRKVHILTKEVDSPAASGENENKTP